MKQKKLSKSEIKQLNTELEAFGVSLDKKDNVVLYDDEYMKKDDKCIVFYKQNKLIPTLFLMPNLPVVKVDDGAIPFVLKGADIMRPGITDCQDAKKDDLVLITNKDEARIAIGQLLADSQTLLAQDSGKVIANLHHINDEYFSK